MSGDDLLGRTERLAEEFARDRANRLPHRALDPEDFARIAQIGFLRASIPTAFGGEWESAPRSSRAVCEALRILARGDSSVALVCAMHPSVLFAAGWLAYPRVPPPFEEAWAAQRRWAFETAGDGAWWATITSEPGSGGDIRRTAAVARPSGDSRAYRLSGTKHFGSGSGVASFMMTTAVAQGESEPDIFVLNLRGQPWDGSTGLRLIAPWDGHGMIATQSHAFRFDDFPATRVAWPLSARREHPLDGAGFVECCFTAVIVGIVQEAVATARPRVERGASRAYEQAEWARVEIEAWLVDQAYEGMLRSVEGNVPAGAVKGKLAIAELAEAALGRICRVVGGATYGRASPFGFWFEDVRALGFLRPPWSLAYETIFPPRSGEE